MRKECLLMLVLIPFLFTGCSDGNPVAPPDNQAHPAGWIALHSQDLLTVADYDDCRGCHAADLVGSGEAVSCYSCHSFDNAPPFNIHPIAWTDAFIDHREYSRANTASSCSACHGADLLGSSAAPSCFTASVDGIACHPEGPGVAPHLLDEEGSYLAPVEHGLEAKADLIVCQTCHGEIVTMASSPRFNLGIYRTSGKGCEGCHNDYTAHPSVGTRENVNWYGAPYSHAGSGNLAACALCHGSDYEGNVDINAPACIGCHIVDPVANSEGCVSCHSLPPDGSGPVGSQSPNRMGQHNRVGHTTSIAASPGETCVRCHNGAGLGTVNHFDATNPAEVNFQRPDASEDIVAVSDGTNTTCNGSCHIGPNNFPVPHNDATWY